MEWEAKDFQIEPESGQSRVFGCNLQLREAPALPGRWHQVDGVILADGRIKLNREELLRSLAAEAGVEPGRFIAQLADWVGHQAGVLVADAAANF